MKPTYKTARLRLPNTMISTPEIYGIMYYMLSDSSKRQSLTEFHKHIMISYTYIMAIICLCAGLKKMKEVIYPLYLRILINAPVLKWKIIRTTSHKGVSK